MKYISGIHALNLNCNLETCGDWHQSSLIWTPIKFYESDDFIWKDYGIEKNVSIPEHHNTYSVANHIRALLDLLYLGNFATAQGMNENYIGNNRYDEEIFSQVYRMKELTHWKKIDDFMMKEYRGKWNKYKKRKEL